MIVDGRQRDHDRDRDCDRDRTGARLCVGTDIDVRVLRGRADGANVYSNFKQYGLPPPELVRSDNARYTKHFRRTRTAGDGETDGAAAAAARRDDDKEGGGDGDDDDDDSASHVLYDVIMCDPPYGLRAGARKSGSRRAAEDVKPVTAEQRSTHIPQTQPYPVEVRKRFESRSRLPGRRRQEIQCEGGRGVRVLESQVDIPKTRLE